MAVLVLFVGSYLEKRKAVPPRFCHMVLVLPPPNCKLRPVPPPCGADAIAKLVKVVMDKSAGRRIATCPEVEESSRISVFMPLPRTVSVSPQRATDALPTGSPEKIWTGPELVSS